MFIEVHNGRPGYEDQKVRINIQYILEYGNIVSTPQQYKNRPDFKAKTWLNIYPNGQYYLQESIEELDATIEKAMNQYAV